MAFPKSKATGIRNQQLNLSSINVFPVRGDTSTVTQATNRSTGVTCNSTVGQITTDTTSLAAAAEATFTVTNSYVTAKSVIVLSIASGSAATPLAWVSAVADGSFAITISNLHASTGETGAVVINFIVLEGN